VLADRWVSPFGLRLMARQCGKMIEAPDVCPIARQSWQGLAEGLSGAYLPPAHQSLVLAPNGWLMIGTGRSGARRSDEAAARKGDRVHA
jgi:hypothetical protein